MLDVDLCVHYALGMVPLVQSPGSNPGLVSTMVRSRSGSFPKPAAGAARLRLITHHRLLAQKNSRMPIKEILLSKTEKEFNGGQGWS